MAGVVLSTPWKYHGLGASSLIPSVTSRNISQISNASAAMTGPTYLTGNPTEISRFIERFDVRTEESES